MKSYSKSNPKISLKYSKNSAENSFISNQRKVIRVASERPEILGHLFYCYGIQRYGPKLLKYHKNDAKKYVRLTVSSPKASLCFKIRSLHFDITPTNRIFFLLTYPMNWSNWKKTISRPVLEKNYFQTLATFAKLYETPSMIICELTRTIKQDKNMSFTTGNAFEII